MTILNPILLLDWKERYREARGHYVGGYITRIEAMDALRILRFREDALRVEINLWDRALDQRRADRDLKSIEANWQRRRH